MSNVLLPFHQSATISSQEFILNEVMEKLDKRVGPQNMIQEGIMLAVKNNASAQQILSEIKAMATDNYHAIANLIGTELTNQIKSCSHVLHAQ